MIKRVGIVQSNYIPWCGYFDLISQCDEFVFLDDVQYTKNDWRNRNKIKTAIGAQWLTIPCGTNISRRIDQVIVSDTNWARKHWKTITQNYNKTRYFSEFEEVLKAFYWSWQSPTSLSAINQTLITHISQEILGLHCQFHSSRHLNVDGVRTARLAAMVQKLEGTHYISGPSAKSYLNFDIFREKKIDVIFAKYPRYGPYSQKGRAFIENLSILDAIFNLGYDVNNFFGCA